MAALNQLPRYFFQIIVCLGPILGSFIMWQTIKLMGFEYWIRVPRQSHLKQWGQNGLIFILYLIVVNLVQVILSLGLPTEAERLVGIGSAVGEPELGIAYLWYQLIAYLNVLILSTLGLFGLILNFMQSWISPHWVKWVAENYSEHHQDILMFASQGEERKKWRLNRNFEEFQEWVRKYVHEKYETYQ